jgi:hypothetical protein
MVHIGYAWYQLECYVKSTRVRTHIQGTRNMIYAVVVWLIANVWGSHMLYLVVTLHMLKGLNISKCITCGILLRYRLIWGYEKQARGTFDVIQRHDMRV